MWNIYEYYSALEKKELPFSTTWMDLEDIMLSKIKMDIKRQISCDLTFTWNERKKRKRKKERKEERKKERKKERERKKEGRKEGRKKITSVGKDVEKLEPLYIAGGDVKWCNHCGKKFGCSSKITIQSRNCTHRYISK